MTADLALTTTVARLLGRDRTSALATAKVLLIEDTVTGTALIQQLKRERRLGVPTPTSCRPVGSKAERAISESPAMEAGHVHLPREAPWLAPLFAEMAQLPQGRHDDQVDSITQYLNWVRLHSAPSIGTIRVR